MPLRPCLAALIAGSVLAFTAVHARAATNEETLLARLNALAPSGNAEVRYNLGMFLNNGIGTARDNPAAFKHFSAAADAGHELAAYKVGCYLAGQFPGVVPRDENAALSFKLRAAEAGYDIAQFDVGLRLGKQGDMGRALQWWERASRQGHRGATVHLANHLSGPASLDKPKGYALLLLAQEQQPKTTPELAARIAELGALLGEPEKAEAGRIRAAWLTGKSPLTVKAETGIKSLPALLGALEQPR